MRFSYNGPEDAVTIFGATFARGVPVDVDSADSIAKLKYHPQFTTCGDDVSAAPADHVEVHKRRGRPPKARP